jgi:hypothetical protein
VPWPYLAIHALLFVVACMVTGLIARRSRRAGLAVVSAVVLLGMGLQLVVGRFPRAFANGICWVDLVFFSKFTVHIAGVVLVGALVAETRRGPRVRATLLALILLGLAGWTSRDIVLAPAPLTRDRVHPPTPVVALQPGPKAEVVAQTEESSCAAAAAATLLRALRVDPGASESRLAGLALTHPQEGTSDLGLYRALRLSAPGRSVRFATRTLAELRALGTPAIVFVGLSRERVPDEETYAFLRDKCNWREDESHAVVCFGFGRDEANGHAWDVAWIGDPTYGIEHWGLDHFRLLWDGTTLEVR